jgi:hypothetical protein
MQANLKETEMHGSVASKELVYLAVVAGGGSIPDDQDQWLHLGRAAGYTGHHDLAGFYGGRVPSMVRADGKRQLTAAGWERARRCRTS